MKPGLLLTLALTATQPAAVDLHGDPLPPGAVARLGTVRFRAPSDVRGLTFSPDGKRLAARTSWGLQAWDATGRPLWYQGALRDQGAGLAFVADGKLLAARVPNVIGIWDAQTGKLVRALTFALARAIRFYGAPQGSAFAIVSDQGEVFLADATKDDSVRLLHRAPATHDLYAAWSRDGTRFAVATGKRVSFWIAATAKQQHQFEVSEEVLHLAFGENDRTLAVVTQTRTTLHDAFTGKELKELTPHVKNVLALWFSDDGKRLAVAGAAGKTLVRLWDTDTGKVLHGFERDAEARAAAFAPDGKTVALSSFENRVGLWYVETGSPAVNAEGHGWGVSHVSYLPDGKHIVTAARDGEARVWEAATGRLVRTLRHGHPDMLYVWRCVAPAGRLLVTAEPGGQLGLWKLPFGDRQLVKVPVEEQFDLSDVSEDGETVVLRTKKAVLVWDVGADRIRARCEPGGALVMAALSPDGRWVVIIQRHVTRLWDAFSGQPVRTLADGDQERISCFQGFTPDGRFTLVTNLGLFDGKPRLVWQDVRSGAETTLTPDKRVWDIVHSPDQRLWATVHDNGVVQVWEARSRLRLWEFIPAPHLETKAPLVNGLAFAPDRRHLAIAVADSSVLIYDLNALVSDVAGRVKELMPATRAALWKALAGDEGEDAFRAAAVLAATPEETVADLRTRLTPVLVVSDKHMARLIADLDAETFAKRDAATKALAALGDLAEPPLRELLSSNPTLEVRRRAELLLEALEKRYTQFPSPALFAERALDLLERIGTAKAGTLLETLARGDPRARQTRHAREALRRLGENGG
jgi:WD40 repeat protein